VPPQPNGKKGIRRSFCGKPATKELCDFLSDPAESLEEHKNAEEANMQALHEAGRIAAHRGPPPLPAGLADRADGVILRYDGLVDRGTPMIFAVATLADLSRIDAAVLEGLTPVLKSPDGRLRGSPHAFFREGPEGIALYVDTDRHPDFVARVAQAARAAGLGAFHCEGDLRHMQTADFDIAPSGPAAFLANGFRPVPASEAVAVLAELRTRVREKGCEPDAGSAAPSF
jgi:hypothetical protein